MIGTIADDVTGGTDAAVAFRRQGLRTGIYFGVPIPGIIDRALDAVVIALKTRTIPPTEAVSQSLGAAEAILQAGAAQLYYKYCSTFDSTSDGNIGPVFEALAELTGADRVVTTPSSPEHGRTSYQGYLFVHSQLLSESHMRNHPLTPMRDSALPRLMDAQLPHPASTVVPHHVVRAGPEAIGQAISATDPSYRYIFPDALTDEDLLATARAVADAPLTGGGAGLAGALAKVRAERRESNGAGAPSELVPEGTAVVLAGSCSRRTLAQIEQMHRAGRPSYRLDALEQGDPASLAAEALAWYDSLPEGEESPLIYSSLPPAQLHEVQFALGVERSATILESAVAQVARGLQDRGVTRFIAAGGETSGSVVAALNVRGGEIGVEAAQGVPWIHTDNGLDLLLKSGNFGELDLLVTASQKEMLRDR